MIKEITTIVDGPISAEVLAEDAEGMVKEAAETSAHIATLPYKVISQMLKHPLTDIGIEKFKNDWGNK